MKTRTIHIISVLTVLLTVVLVPSCIKNDIPFPRIQANFLSLNIKGQDGGTIIDTVAMTATVAFPEEIDIRRVSVTGYSLTPGAHLVDSIFNTPVDLTTPLPVTLRLYQDYTWKIIANQPIERYFEVEGQIGASVIDVPGRRVVVNVAATSNLAAVSIVRAKLGPFGSVTTPALEAGDTFDGTKPYTVNVEAYGTGSEWTIYVEPVEVSVRTLSVDAWTCVAWINGQGEVGKEVGAQYRLAGSDAWTEVPAADITVDGGLFTARVLHLSPSTAYQARVMSDGMYGEVIDFTTGTEAQMPNSDFEYWWLNKKVWCPWAEDGTPYWGTGNQGATTLGDSNTTPTDDTPTGSGWAARLETRFVGIGRLGKIAAGNIFVGSYVRTDGTNGILSFGRDFAEHPTKLRGQFKYNPVAISHASDEMKSLVGQPDTCVVWIALIDSSEPFELRTNPSNRRLFDPNADDVVAYGIMQTAQNVASWSPFEVELKYNSTSRRPRYILVTGSASKYGDYFTGGDGSTLYLDDLELGYDY
ncbi:MAG: PCMD domain-containing protein [Muribaculaceae bacterium]|nr:PCMD domain-containing protein [Muribaculaceae bacterium]